MKILVIRRDNIGDLVCTTPLLSALRKAYPSAWIAVLANAYNAPILNGNPDIDAVFAYRKAKHQVGKVHRWRVWHETARLLWQLRRKKFDLVLCASPGAYRFARLLAARRTIDMERSGEGHEVEITFRLLRELGLDDVPGRLTLVADAQVQARLASTLGAVEGGVTLAIHISARKPRQRWPLDNFAELIRRIVADGIVHRILLFWAPGSAADPMHPGDDEKAGQLIERLQGLPVVPIATRQLADLVAGLSLADVVLCSDGGAMHIAAGLAKPIVCFFGNSDATRWHPWGVPYELLQKPSQDVTDISVEEALAALERLMARL